MTTSIIELTFKLNKYLAVYSKFILKCIIIYHLVSPCIMVQLVSDAPPLLKFTLTKEESNNVRN